MMKMNLQQKVYTNGKKQAHITCPKCHRQKNVSGAIMEQKQITVKCPCQTSFDVFFENKKWRLWKNIDSKGTYKDLDSKRLNSMVVERLSMQSVVLKTIGRHQQSKGDVLEVDFLLDNVHESEIVRKATVISVSDDHIEAEFHPEKKYDAVLAFYLHPTSKNAYWIQ